MVKLCDNLDLVGQARAGDAASLNRLALRVRQRLEPYLRRSVPDANVSDDVSQGDSGGGGFVAEMSLQAILQ